jgi:UDP-N-acetylglucosamine 2-epimerase
MVHLMKHSLLILTDSGGVQEEAPSLAVPALVMRDTTERPEGVDEGLVKLVGTKRREIVEQAARVIDYGSFVPPAKRGTNPYGDGKASDRIVGVLLGGAKSDVEPGFSYSHLVH